MGRVFRRFPGLIAVFLVTACSSGLLFEPHRVNKHNEVGTFHISATLVAPWDEFVADLSPGFVLTEENALTSAIPKTAVTEKQLLDSFLAALKIAPPVSSSSSTVTEALNADGTTTRTGSSEETTAAGDVSKVPDAPDAPSATNAQPSSTATPRALPGVG